jgi:hypothetical protein
MALRRIRPSRHEALDRSFMRPHAYLMERMPACALRPALPGIDRDESALRVAAAPACAAEPHPPASHPAPDLRALIGDLRASVGSLHRALAVCAETLSTPCPMPRMTIDPEVPDFPRPRPYLVISRRRGAA